MSARRRSLPNWFGYLGAGSFGLGAAIAGIGVLPLFFMLVGILILAESGAGS